MLNVQLPMFNFQGMNFIRSPSFSLKIEHCGLQIEH